MNSYLKRKVFILQNIDILGAIMDIEIEIHTYDGGLISDLLGKDSASSGEEVKITDEAKLKFKGKKVFLAAEHVPQIIYFILNVSSNVACGLAASWLYDKIKGRNIKKLIIERTEMEIERGEIKRVIEEKWRMKL